ncbi:hypothetical protein FOZ60_009154, partial [Perkinsus olseni]
SSVLVIVLVTLRMSWMRAEGCVLPLPMVLRLNTIIIMLCRYCTTLNCRGRGGVLRI